MSSLFSAFSRPTPSKPASSAQRTSEARTAFDASLRSVGTSTLDSELQLRAKDIHKNALLLDKQDRAVNDSTGALEKQGDGLESLLEDTRGELKGLAARGKGNSNELGDAEGKEGTAADDFEEEMRRIEADLDLLDEAMDDIEGRDAGRQEASGPKDEQQRKDR
jgi:hypothetical protein